MVASVSERAGAIRLLEKPQCGLALRRGHCRHWRHPAEDAGQRNVCSVRQSRELLRLNTQRKDLGHRPHALGETLPRLHVMEGLGKVRGVSPSPQEVGLKELARPSRLSLSM